MCQPVERGGLGADIREGGGGGGRRSGDRGGADKTTVLCKPRYQCGVNRALTPSAGNQPLPLLPSTSWVFAGLLLERACHAPVWRTVIERVEGVSCGFVAENGGKRML